VFEFFAHYLPRGDNYDQKLNRKLVRMTLSVECLEQM